MKLKIIIVLLLFFGGFACYVPVQNVQKNTYRKVWNSKKINRFTEPFKRANLAFRFKIKFNPNKIDNEINETN